MKLFIVRDNDRWGFSLNVVRAASAEEAMALVAPNSKGIYAEELPQGDTPAILWCHDHSPDTPH